MTYSVLIGFLFTVGTLLLEGYEYVSTFMHFDMLTHIDVSDMKLYCFLIENLLFIFRRSCDISRHHLVEKLIWRSLCAKDHFRH